MDFFGSSKGKKDGKKSGLFGKKTVSKSNPATPPHPATGRLPPPLSKQRAETEYDFSVSEEPRDYRKQPASERIPNSHTRPPVYGYGGTPDHRRGYGRERMEAMSYEPEDSAPSSPYHPSGNHTPERRRKPSEYSREHQDRMYEADTRSNASPFHPFKSPSPSPYHTPDRHSDHDPTNYEVMYEPGANTMFQNRAPSPFHPARSRSPSPFRTPDRNSNHGNEQPEELYERDGDVTPRDSSPPSPFHPAASRSPPPQYRTPDRHRKHHRNEQIEDLYEPDGNVTPRSSSPLSPFHPAASRSPQPQTYRSNRTPDSHGNHHDNEQLEAIYEADSDVIMRNKAPLSPVHGAAAPYYSSSDDDNRSTYLYPELSTPPRSIPVSANSTPIHHNYQIIAAETYEHDKHFEPPELPDESQSFTLQEITKMRGLKEKEESLSITSEAYVSVANYRVKLSVSETLQAILNKYGDIGASSKLQSLITRSYYLESLASVVMELKSTMLRDLTKTRVAEMAAVVKDMESVKIDVSWLKKPVTELVEAVEYFGKYDAVKVEREVCEKEMKKGKGEMEKMKTELEKREKEIRECREKVTVVAGKLGELEMKGSRLNKNLELFQSKVEKFEGEAVLVHV